MSDISLNRWNVPLCVINLYKFLLFKLNRCNKSTFQLLFNSPGCTCRHMLWFTHADVHEPDQSGRWSVSQRGVMWRFCLTSLPLLFVLITERFTLLYWPISYCDCEHHLLVAVLNCACTFEPPAPVNPLPDTLCTLYMLLLCSPLLFTCADSYYLPRPDLFLLCECLYSHFPSPLAAPAAC